MTVAPPALQPPQLRPYQADVINALYAKVREGFRRIVIIAGTGAGKTIISGQICAHAEAKGSRLLFLVHLDVLVGQTYAKMQAFGLNCGFIKAGWPENPDAPIQIASVQTMAKRDWWRNWSADVIFYDEGHTTAFSQIGQQVLYQTHAQAVHIAMTATPYRLGTEQLGDHFQTFVATPPPAALQQMGFLASMQYYGLPRQEQMDLGEIRIVAGDYDEGALKNACDRPELIQRIVQEWQRLTPGKRTIAFCVDVEHAHHVAEAFRKVGIAAETVDGSTPPKERQQRYQDLGEGTLLVLTSCNVISIGFDVPAVEVGLLLRPTLSLALHYQQIGRVMRISPDTGKTHGIILDQAGNLERLGFPEDVQTYALPTGDSPPPSQERPAISKQCPQCHRCVPTVKMQCPGCGYDWAAERPAYDLNLIQLMGREQLRQIQDEPTRYRVFQAFRQRVFHRGYNPDFARQEYFDCFGAWPPEDWYRGAIFGQFPSLQEMRAYQYYLGVIAQRQGKPFQWIVAEFEKEFGLNQWQKVF
jgi:superfamily II DNA or RNA helicase